MINHIKKIFAAITAGLVALIGFVIGNWWARKKEENTKQIRKETAAIWQTQRSRAWQEENHEIRKKINEIEYMYPRYVDNYELDTRNLCKRIDALVGVWEQHNSMREPIGGAAEKTD